MKKGFWLICLSILTVTCAQAQKPEQALADWSAAYPIEKIYFQSDRDNYVAGETAWLKAYLYADFLPDTISSNLYIELLKNNSLVISRQVFPISSGNSTAQVELPDSLETGYYILRSYTPAMLKLDAQFVYSKSIFVYGRKKTTVTQPVKEPASLRILFFPESGNLVSGLENMVAFKATDANGLPVNVSGIVKNDNDEQLGELTSYHDGMGQFLLIPDEKEKYYAVLNNDSTVRYDLPAPVAQGAVLRITDRHGAKFFDIQQSSGEAFHAAYILGQMQGHVVFRQDFTQNKDRINGVINVSQLNSGILQVTVFNKDDMPLAERLVFVDNGDYIQHGDLTIDTLNFTAKAKNTFSISFPDTIQGNISVAVTDPGYDLSSRYENIFSALLLTGDLRGYVHHPSYYFSSRSDSVQTALDLVMMTNGWRRFIWSSVLHPASKPLPYINQGFISLNGHINIQGTKKPFANQPFMAIIASPDSSRIVQLINTDSKGNFHMDSLIFFGTSQIVFKDIRGRKSSLFDVSLSGDSLMQRFKLPPLQNQLLWGDGTNLSERLDAISPGYDQLLKNNSTVLKEVRIKVYKKSPVQELEEKYTSGAFSGFSRQTIDLVNTTEPIYDLNIFDYLQARVVGLEVDRTNGSYQLYYRQAISLGQQKPFPVQLYLDEMPVDANLVASIPPNQIALIKLYSSLVSVPGNGVGGVLSIYTKKGNDVYNAFSSEDLIRYRGYSVIREFYAPDYAADPSTLDQADNRVTLQWIPDISINGIHPQFQVNFYNNDKAKRFKIVVEGMTGAGKMISMEKTVSLP